MSARLDLNGRWILLTGCDSGIGRGVLGRLAAGGARVIACCFTEEGAAEAREAGAALVPQLDLTDEAARHGLVRQVRETLDGAPLWGLVHNAGRALPGFVDYLPLDFYRAVMELNFFVPVDLTRRLLTTLEAGRGRVVAVSSVDGLVSLPGNAPYDASKFALEAWADALRCELAQRGVQVSVINPSTMRTPLALRFFEGHRTAWEAMARQEPAGAWRARFPEEWLEHFIYENSRNLERIAEPPDAAIHDIVHALTARTPRLRYLSGRLARTFFYGLWVGPESLSHRIKAALIRPRPPG